MQITSLRKFLFRKAELLHREEDGVTAVEFALLAFPFFALIGVILETSIYLLTSQVFDSAVDDASRQIMIGATIPTDGSSYSPADFKSEICNNTFGLIDCPKIKLRVRPITSFATADTTPPMDDDGNWILNEVFTGVDGRKVMLVEAYYKWDAFFGFDFGFSKYGDAVVISSARVFMTEPF